MKNICILYNGGSYGTFLEWCLNYFSALTVCNSLPFDNNGSSHKFEGNLVLNFSGCVNYINSSDNFSIVRVHPKTNKDEDIIGNLEFINKNFKKIIYLIPTKNTIAWNINNKFEKIWEEGWIEHEHNELNLCDRLGKWNKEKLEEMEIWELREFLSFYLYPQHISECELVKMQDIQDKFTKIKFITIESLRDNFKEVIFSLLTHCELTLMQEDKIEEIYQNWINCQYHCFKDKLINNIIDSILTNTAYQWEKLTLVDESLIQYYLRQHKIEIKCYNLNNFPKNTEELRKYLDYTA